MGYFWRIDDYYWLFWFTEDFRLKEQHKTILKTIGVILLIIAVNIGYTEIRLLTLSNYDPRIERTYDISVWLFLDYTEGNIIRIEIPQEAPAIPIYNDQFEVIRWVYSYSHKTLNISNNPAYRDASLFIFAPRDVIRLFSSIVCDWYAEDDHGILANEDFIWSGVYYLAEDSSIENTIWQSSFTDPLDVVITLTV